MRTVPAVTAAAIRPIVHERSGEAVPEITEIPHVVAAALCGQPTQKLQTGIDYD
jgi:hypothetical protein